MQYVSFLIYLDRQIRNYGQVRVCILEELFGSSPPKSGTEIEIKLQVDLPFQNDNERAGKSDLEDIKARR